MAEDFLKKHEHNPYEDLFWNLPETPRGSVNVIGGNAQSFQTVVRTAEFLTQHYRLAEVKAVLPETLRTKLPTLTNFQFLPATETGSFNGEKLPETLVATDYNLLIGDLSKNQITAQAIARALTTTTAATATSKITETEAATVTEAAAARPILITRDAVDLLIAAGNLDQILIQPQIGWLLSAQQLQKMLRAIYYPKMLTLSQSLLQTAELLHKFTLSYAAGIVTLFSGQILVAQNGVVEATALENSGYSPLTLWSGQFAAKIVALNLANPHNFVAASLAAVFHAPDSQP